MIDAEICSLWRAAGGRIHGPHLDTATIPKKGLMVLLRALLDERDRLRDRLASQDKDIESLAAERDVLRMQLSEHALDEMARDADEKGLEY